MKALATLAWDFFFISAFIPGGGMAMLPVMHRTFVERRKWFGEGEMMDMVATMQSLPGLIVVAALSVGGYFAGSKLFPGRTIAVEERIETGNASLDQDIADGRARLEKLREAIE